MSGNIFVVLQNIFLQHSQTSDKDMNMQFEKEKVLQGQYEAQLAKWQTDSQAFTDPSNMTTTPGAKSISVMGYVLLGVLTVIGAILGFAAALTGVGAAVGAAILGATGYGVARFGMPDIGPSTTTMDSSKYGLATTNCQNDQQMAATLQQNQSQVFQQFINPDQDTKTQNANMLQAAIKWMQSETAPLQV